MEEWIQENVTRSVLSVTAKDGRAEDLIVYHVWQLEV